MAILSFESHNKKAIFSFKKEANFSAEKSNFLFQNKRQSCLPKKISEKATGDAVRIGGHLFGSAARHDAAARSTAARAHIDDVVGAADDVEVVLDHDKRRAVRDERLKDAYERAHVKRMQADGRLVEDKDAPLLRFAISLASFRRCASPPDRLGVSSPSVRYPSPRSSRTCRRWQTSFISLQAESAVCTSIAISSGKE